VRPKVERDEHDDDGHGAACRTSRAERLVLGLRVNPKNANAQLQMGEAEQAARTLGAQIGFVKASSEDEIEKVFDGFNRQRLDALLMLSDSFLNRWAPRIAELALMHALATCFVYRRPAAAGGLMSYGASPGETSRQKGVYAGRILHGERPADLITLLGSAPAAWPLAARAQQPPIPVVGYLANASLANAERSQFMSTRPR
jgi:hypothetical protein